MSVHVERLHKGHENPLKAFRMPNCARRTVQKINPNPLLPDFDLNGPIQPSIELQDILRRIMAMSHLELMFVLQAINEQLQK